MFTAVTDIFSTFILFQCKFSFGQDVLMKSRLFLFILKRRWIQIAMLDTIYNTFRNLEC